MVQKLVLMHFQESKMVVHGGQLPRKTLSFSDLPGSCGVLASDVEKGSTCFFFAWSLFLYLF
jgi:hypothetical protein